MTQTEIIRMIPETSNGKPKHVRLAEIKRLLSTYKYEGVELKLIAAEVDQFCQRYKRSGPYKAAGRRPR
jgi:hypothetical protein